MKRKSKSTRRIAERLQPRTARDEEFADQHIRQARNEIRERWTEREMAARTGIPFKPVETRVIHVDFLRE